MDIHSYIITIFDTLQTQANNQKNHNSMKEVIAAVKEHQYNKSMKNTPLQLQVITEIVWKDINSNIIEKWSNGAIVNDCYGPYGEGRMSHYITPMGWVWADEVKVIK